MKQALADLLSHPGAASYPTAEQLCAALAPRVMHELEQAENYSAALETELAKEVENGRLFRLLVKLEFIAQQTGSPEDPAWREVRG